MSSGSITLAEVAERTPLLVIACTRCERAGRYRLDTLIAQHGADFGVPMLLRHLSAGCPKRLAVSAYDLCGIHAPELSRLFGATSRAGLAARTA